MESNRFVRNWEIGDDKEEVEFIEKKIVQRWDI